MAGTAQLEIKVVYEASSAGRPRRAVRVNRPRGRAALLALSALNLLAAGALCYVTWWEIDKKVILDALVLRTPFEVDLDAAAGALFGETASASSGTQSAGAEPPDRAMPMFTGRTAQIMIPAVAYGWLTLATVASCLLAFAAGAGLAARGGGAVRRAGLILALGIALALGWGAFDVLSTFGMRYPTDKLRMAMAGLVLLAMLLGVAKAPRIRRVVRWAAFGLILSAVGAAVGLALGQLCGALEPQYTSPTFIGIVFVVHSLWGWVLLPVARRLGH